MLLKDKTTKIEARARRAAWERSHRCEINARRRQRYALNPEKRLAYDHAWKAANPERVIARNETAKQAPGYKAKLCAQNAKKRATAKQRIRNSISACMGRALRKNGASKGGESWEVLVGYTIQQLRKHLESLFSDGMSWDNYGVYGWHIDHIEPVCAFSYTDTEHADFLECWGLSNLRPLWAKDNMAKAVDDRKLSVHKSIQPIKNQ